MVPSVFHIPVGELMPPLVPDVKQLNNVCLMACVVSHFIHILKVCNGVRG